MVFGFLRRDFGWIRRKYHGFSYCEYHLLRTCSRYLQYDGLRQHHNRCEPIYKCQRGTQPNCLRNFCNPSRQYACYRRWHLVLGFRGRIHHRTDQPQQRRDRTWCRCKYIPVDIVEWSLCGCARRRRHHALQHTSGCNLPECDGQPEQWWYRIDFGCFNQQRQLKWLLHCIAVLEQYQFQLCQPREQYRCFDGDRRLGQ